MKVVKVSREAVGLPPEIPQSIRKGSKKAFAKHLRKNPTKSEEVLKQTLIELGYKFQFQVIVAGYIPDYLFRKKRIIELDGASHIGREDYDATRDSHLREKGYEILRLPSRMVFQDMDGILKQIEAFIGKPPRPRNRKRDREKAKREVKVVKKDAIEKPKGQRTFTHTWEMRGKTWTVTMVGDAQGDKHSWQKFLQSLDVYNEIVSDVGVKMERRRNSEGI